MLKKKRELDIETHARIYSLRGINDSNREIARQLNICECWVRKISSVIMDRQQPV